MTAPTRQVVIAALVLLALGTLGAVKAGLAGGAFMYDLELETPELAKVSPAIHDPKTPRLARRVYLVIIDGLRLDKSYELPFIDELRRRGVDTEASSHYPTWSRPNYVSILTGVPPAASGVRTNHHNTPVQLDSLMDRAKAAGLRAASATDYDVLPRLFLRKRVAAAAPVDIDAMEDPFSEDAFHAADAPYASPFEDARYAPWPGGFTEASSALVARDDELVVLLIGAVDSAGHGKGGASPEYREAAEIADRALARVLARVDLTQDAIVITADHGHTDRGGHGGVEPEVMSVPLVMAGVGVKAGATATDAKLIDISPTVSALLGIPAPGHGLGRTLVELLDIDVAGRVAHEISDTQRLVMTRGVVAGAEARAAVSRLEHRAARIALVIGGAVLASFLAALLIRRRVMRLDLRVLLVSVPAFFVVYYALIGTLGQRFSPSLLPAQGHLAATMAKYGLVAMVFQLVASLLALRNIGSLGQRLAAANGIAWMGLMTAMVPAGLAWAFFPPPFISVPGPVSLVLIPAVEVAVACAAVDVALTLLVELIVFVSRVYHRR